MAEGMRDQITLRDLYKRADKIEEGQARIEAQICKFNEVLAEQSQKFAEFMEAFKAQKEGSISTQAVNATPELNRTRLSILAPSMVSSDDLPEVSGCLVFSIEALCFLIFKRLPVKSLCRFRCVCRSWNSLITSPSFVAEHFSFVSSAAKKSYLLFNVDDSRPRIYPLYHPHQNRVTYLDHPFRARRLWIVDVIHGIVCLRPSFSESKEPAALWNPSTRKYLNVPLSHSGRLDYDQRVGFGFQSSKNDFKVVTILYHPRGLERPVFKVFSLQTGLWVAVASDHCNVGYDAWRTPFPLNACFLHGTIHWIASSFASTQEGGNCTYALLCFDCELDKLSKMELPQELIHLSPITSPIRVCKYGGKIAVCGWPMRDGPFVLWVMEEYGVVSTWTKLSSIGCPAKYRRIIMRGEDGDIIIYDHFEALVEKTKKRLWDRKQLYSPLSAGVFEESLFPLEQTSHVPRQ